MWLEKPQAFSVEKTCGKAVNKLGDMLQLRYGVYSEIQDDFGGDRSAGVL